MCSICPSVLTFGAERASSVVCQDVVTRNNANGEKINYAAIPRNITGTRGGRAISAL